MKVGVTLFAQNYTDWDRFEYQEANPSAPIKPPLITDGQIYREQIQLGRLIEPLGFDSLWTVEHHFTPYTMVNDPTQFLAYFAGCTERISMGTMVSVTPWHDPLRVAESFITLEHMLEGRSLKIGLGRGLGLREFSAFRVNMDESRTLFKESLDILRAGLRDEWFSYNGGHHKIPRTTLRPRPMENSKLLDNIYIAWGSPSSMPVAAHENTKPLFIPQRTWDEHKKEFIEYNRIRMQVYGWGPERPTVVTWVYCTESKAEAQEEGTRYMMEYGDSALRHYQLLAGHFDKLKGYEYYAQTSKMVAQMGLAGNDFARLYVQNNVWGTPEECIAKLEFINSMMGADEFVGVFSFGAMPVAKAEASMRLFADKVLPKVKAFKPADASVLTA
jgi:alkanesulfonate monooxygenase SsuD/methylene tetrahydromethanopterin reductase-like flavin-dependent oxidoreductase (luciferase family)